MNSQIEKGTRLSELITPRHPNILRLDQVHQQQDQKFGGKAENLATLEMHGLPIPTAVCVSTEAFAYYQQTGQLDPSLVSELERIRKIMGGKVALRSSATCEDGETTSMAGVFKSEYLKREDQTIEEALLSIFQQAESSDVSDYLESIGQATTQVEMGIILQVLVEKPELSGVVYTDVDEDSSLIQYAEGYGDRLVDGETDGSAVIFSPAADRVMRSKNTDLLPIPLRNVRRLSAYAADIKTIFSEVPQDIEFSIKDGEEYILQARTLTTEVSNVDLEMSREDIVQYTRELVSRIIDREKVDLNSEAVVLSDSNFSELLPRAKEMDFGVFAYIFTGDDGVPGAIQLGRQEMGYPLGDESVGFMHYVGGKPYFSIARDAHTFYAGFPDSRQEYNDTLVAEYLAQIEQDPSKGEYPEMGLYLQDPTLEDLTNLYGERGQEYFDTYLEFKNRMADAADIFMGEYLDHGKPETDSYIDEMERVDLGNLSTNEVVEYAHHILEHLRTVSCVNFVKSARLGFYYSQRLQSMLREYFVMDKDQSEATFSVLNQGLEGSEITQANLYIAQATSLSHALEIGRETVGHYSTGEMLEIRHPRLKDVPDALQLYVEGIFNARQEYMDEFNNQSAERESLQEQLISALDGQPVQTEFEHTMRAAQTYMALRETVKYQFVREYAILRDALLELADRTGYESDDVFHLYPRELADFAHDPDAFLAKIDERQERFKLYPLLDLPPVIRESDLSMIGEEEIDPDIMTEFFGKLLAQGKALEEAIIVNIEDFDTVEAARDVLLFYRKQVLPIILVASQMNLSHDPLIMQVDSLIIENAGLVSHGAQRARELGRGAIGGIKAKYLKTGDHVSFDPSTKRVARISNGAK